MVDVAHEINSVLVCLQEATLKTTRSMSSSLKYLRSKQAAKRNSTSEREALSDKPEEDPMKRLACRDSRDATFLWELGKYALLIMATQAYSLSVSPAGLHWPDKHGSHLADGRELRVFLRCYRPVLYYFITAFVACIFMVSSLRWLLWMLGMFCIMVAFGAAGSCWRLASEAPETLEGVRWRPVMLAALVAIVSYHYYTRLSTRDEYGYPELRAGQPERFKVAFLCFNCMVSLVFILMLVTTRTVTCHFDDELLWAFRLYTGASVIGITGAFAIWGNRSLMSSFWFSAFMQTILVCIGLQVLAFLLKALADLIPGPQETMNSDKHRHTIRNKLLLLGVLAASITYQAGLEPPGGHWLRNGTDGLHHYHAGDPHTIYPPTCQTFFYCNATAFAVSLVILILLLGNVWRTQGIKYCALQVAMTLDLLELIGAYASASCSESDPSVDKDDTNTPIKGTPLGATWRVACAAAHHMTGDQSLLLTGGFLPMSEGSDDVEVVMVQSATNGEAVLLQVRGSGSVRTESITLDDVWYVPGLDLNLVSTGQLARQGCAINLGPSGCRITMDDALVGTARFTEACQFELDYLKVA